MPHVFFFFVDTCIFEEELAIMKMSLTRATSLVECFLGVYHVQRPCPCA
jgi:hypothetical protein